MRAIQHFLPHPRHVEVDRVFVKADPKTAWEAARHFDVGQVPWIRFLFNLRTLPDRLAGKKSTHEDVHIGVDQVAENGVGFIVLQETPGREVVVGSVGQFWHLQIPFADVAASAFRDFNTPGWGKLAWAISVEPFGEGSTIAIELRITATDEHSWRLFNRYYTYLIGLPSHLIRLTGLKHLQAELGKLKQPDADDRPLPGDDRLPNARYQYDDQTRIEAPASIVWRYLMQLGCDRAGWYSIDTLDHGGKPSVEHLVPGWETRSLGDRISATPELDGFFEVYSVEPEQHFLIGGGGDRYGGHFKMSWVFALSPVGDDACLLHARVRAEIEDASKWKEWLGGNVTTPIVHTLMQEVQLKNLKRIAERDAQLRQDESKREAPTSPVFDDNYHPV